MRADVQLTHKCLSQSSHLCWEECGGSRYQFMSSLLIPVENEPGKLSLTSPDWRRGKTRVSRVDGSEADLGFFFRGAVSSGRRKMIPEINGGVNNRRFEVSELVTNEKKKFSVLRFIQISP